jgi:hypothetical protein
MEKTTLNYVGKYQVNGLVQVNKVDVKDLLATGEYEEINGKKPSTSSTKRKRSSNETAMDEFES